MFDNLSHTSGKLVVRKRLKRIDIGKYQLRHMKRANHIFVRVKINARLAANAAVHLGKKRRRNLHEGNAAQIGRRRESAEIAHNSAAECCQHIVAVKMVQNQGLI